MADERLSQNFPDLSPESTNMYSTMITTAQTTRQLAFNEDDLKKITLLDSIKEIMSHMQSLLNHGLVKLLEQFNAKEGKKTISFQPIDLDEALKQSKMTPDEAMIYSHISASGREGIWTKTIKAKTNLHQHVVSRCLKNLENQSAIKVIKSVKYPQRKIYMLYHLTPSIEVTGGPWFTDSELDTDFISTLLIVVWRFVAKKSYPSLKIQKFPKQLSYVNGNQFGLPSLKEILEFLGQTRITEVELSLTDVKSLCDVLEYEERIEKLKNGCYKATWQSVLETSHGAGTSATNGDSDGDGLEEGEEVFNIGDAYRVLQQGNDDEKEKYYLDSYISQ